MTGAAIPPEVIADAVASAKGWLRAADGNDEAVIAGLCETALALAEAFCGQVLVARTFTQSVAAGGDWRPLSAGPVTAIMAVAGADGAALPVAGYAIDIDGDGIGWVRVDPRATQGGVTVTYRAGTAATWAAMPAPIAQGAAMLVAHLFDHRDGDAVPPAAVAALWRPWRRLRLGARR